MKNIVLGINLSHDRSACLLVDGVVRVAVAEERLTRKKHDMPLNAQGERFATVPRRSIEYCLAASGVSLDQVDLVVASTTYVSHVETGQRRALLPDDVAAQLDGVSVARIVIADHHMAHALSAFCYSGFERSAVLVVDGGGGICGYDDRGAPTLFERSTIYLADRARVDVLARSAGTAPYYGNSVGDYYQVAAEFLGFHKGDEGKLMGFSSYGVRERVERQREHYATVLDAIRVMANGEHDVDLACQYDADGGLPAYLRETFGERRTKPDVTRQQDVDLALSFQIGLEKAVLQLARAARELSGASRLCYAGGVALNCVANGKLAVAGVFDDTFIQPAAGDDGTALGNVCWGWRLLHGSYPDLAMKDAFLGRQYSIPELRSSLDKFGVAATEVPLDERARHIASEVVDGKIVAVFDGGSEFGPRALGHRSILCDPRSTAMREVLNARVKHRESFRPFAAMVLREHAAELFEGSVENPYMLMAFPVRDTQAIPAVSHIDGTCRIQTVGSEAPLAREVLVRLRDITGIPVLLNTSFNDSEPIVETPDDALSCFLSTRIDVLYLGPFRVESTTDD